MTNEIIIRHQEYDDFYIDRTGESLYSTGSITIDWGDGTTETTNNNTYSYSHNYYNFTHDDNEGIQTYAGYITVTISGVEEIRDGFLSDKEESLGAQYVDTVTIPNNITSIGDYFLDECGFLTGDIVIPNSVESIGHDFLAGCGMTSIIFENNSAIDVIPDDFARKCMNLTNISFPDNLETIGSNFCCNCPSLTRVEFPEGLIEIGENFLNGQEEPIHLNKLIFPSSFRYLNDGLTGASIDKVIFKSVIPVDMSAGYPDQFDSMIIHVPKNCVNAYANAFTEAFGDYGEDSLSDPNHYRENLTLPETAAKFGTLMRTNLKEKVLKRNATMD